jgi:hypothetical protein
VVLEPVRLISGEAGIGKPHLMHAALEVAEAEECVVLGGRAHDYDAGLAYASLKDVVASMPLDQLDPPTAAARDEFVVAADGAVRRGPRSDVVQSSGAAPGHFRPMSSRRDVSSAGGGSGPDGRRIGRCESRRRRELDGAGLHGATRGVGAAGTGHRDQWAPGSRFAATIGPLVELQGIINLDPLDQHHIRVIPTCWPSSPMSIRLACKRRSTA